MNMKLNLTLLISHQLIFQGMFVAKNIFLKKKLSKPIRGKNKEANYTIFLFVVFIASSILLSLFSSPIGRFVIFNDPISRVLGLLFMLLNLFISATSLVNLGDSWRVGVIQDQKTILVSSGIYRFTRNPYFLSYILLLLSYTILLQNTILLVLAVITIISIHKMILREEEYLFEVHGTDYLEYKKRVPRYLLF